MRYLLTKFKLHPNHYYNYRKNRNSNYRDKKNHLKTIIKETYHERGGTIGYRMICDVLNRKDISCSYGTVYRYMKELNIKATIMVKKRPYLSKGKKHHIFDNRVDREFNPPEPNEIWCTDFTQISLKNGKKRYNCTIIDLYDRSVVATANSKFIDTELAINTLKKAIKANPVKNSIILHTDQGSQFASRRFIAFCEENRIFQSMSRAGNPYDNSPMERYYNTFKSELINQYIFETDEDLNEAVNDYVFDWYNYRRPHSFNGGLTPFEARYKTSR